MSREHKGILAGGHLIMPGRQTFKFSGRIGVCVCAGTQISGSIWGVVEGQIPTMTEFSFDLFITLCLRNSFLNFPYKKPCRTGLLYILETW